MTKPPNFHFRVWSAETVALLKDWWWEGYQADEIATMIGGVTPQQCRDKAHREEFHRNPALRQPKIKEPQPAHHEGGEAINITNVASRECRWIYGDPGEKAQMCGNATIGGGPWCAFHQQKAYQP